MGDTLAQGGRDERRGPRCDVSARRPAPFRAATARCAATLKPGRWLGVGLLTGMIGLAGCGVPEAANTPATVAGPMRREPVRGTDRSIVILTDAAASRRGITTAPVGPAAPAADGEGAAPTGQSLVPLAA